MARCTAKAHLFGPTKTSTMGSGCAIVFKEKAFLLGVTAASSEASSTRTAKKALVFSSGRTEGSTSDFGLKAYSTDEVSSSNLTGHAMRVNG